MKTLNPNNDCFTLYSAGGNAKRIIPVIIDPRVPAYESDVPGDALPEVAELIREKQLGFLDWSLKTNKAAASLTTQHSYPVFHSDKMPPFRINVRDVGAFAVGTISVDRPGGTGSPREVVILVPPERREHFAAEAVRHQIQEMGVKDAAADLLVMWLKKASSKAKDGLLAFDFSILAEIPHPTNPFAEFETTCDLAQLLCRSMRKWCARRSERQNRMKAAATRRGSEGGRRTSRKTRANVMQGVIRRPA